MTNWDRNTMMGERNNALPEGMALVACYGTTAVGKPCPRKGVAKIGDPWGCYHHRKPSRLALPLSHGRAST